MNSTTLRFGYVQSYFPELYYDFKGTLQGQMAEFGQILAHELNRKFYLVQIDHYDSKEIDNENNTYDGVLSEVLAGNIFSNLDGTVLNPSRIYDFKWTQPIEYNYFNFYEGRVVKLREESSLLFFLVYSPSAIVLYLAAIGIFIAILRLRKCFITCAFDHLPTPLKISGAIYSITIAILLIETTFILATHSAEFSGDNVIITIPDRLTMGELIPELREGTKTWISRSRNEVNLEESEVILGKGGTPILVGSFDRLIDLLCMPRSKFVTAIYASEKLEMNGLKERNDECQLFKVESTPRSLLEGDSLLEAYLYPEVFSYVVRRDTPTKIVEMMNNIILTIFQEDMRRGFFQRRAAGPKNRAEPKTGLSVASFNQLTIIRAAPCFYLLLVGYAIGVILFLVEHLIFPVKLISRVQHFIRTDKNLIRTYLGATPQIADSAQWG